MSKEQGINKAYDAIERGFVRQEKNGLAWVYAKRLFDAGAYHGFTTRHGGISHDSLLVESLNFGERTESRKNIDRNLDLLAQATNIPVDTMVNISYEHGNKVERVGLKDKGRGILENLPMLPPCDALVTQEEHLTLITSHADCMPIFMVDPKTGSIAGVHSGWMGTSLRIGAKTVEKLQVEFEIDPKNLLVAMGPSISQEYFEVDEPVRDIFAKEFPEVDAIIYKPETKKYHIDLWKIMVAQLLEVGVPSANMVLADSCTYANKHDYYSYRRDGHGCGSMIGFISRKTI